MVKICKHCGNEYGVNTPSHYRLCDEYNRFITRVKSIITKEFLTEEYLNKQRSAANISKELGLDKTRLVKNKLKEFGLSERITPKERATANHRQQLTREVSIKKYGVEHHLMAKEVIDKRIDTIKDRFDGCINVFQHKHIKNKSKETILKKYGVEYITKSDAIKEAISRTNIVRYGVPNPWLRPDIQKKCIQTKIDKNLTTGGYVSKVSQKFIYKIFERLPEYLKENCYFASLNKEFGIWGDNSYLTYDFVIPSLKYCLEYNGTYFHADPTMYSEDWINKKLGLTAKEIWEKDYKKNQYLIDRGFLVDIVWQRENEEEAIERVVTTILSMA